MKFVHIADMHFDAPFIALSDQGNLGDKKRMEQRKIFKKIIEYIKEENIKYFFIAGDLYEHKHIRKSTIEYINDLFKEIENTQIFIAPGNHDPFLKKSYYNTFNWNKNVHIFNSKIAKIETEEADIYGYGFDDFYCMESGIEDLKIENPSKTNILVIHGTLDGATIEDKQYNSMSKKILEEKGFDYIALGHIHKTNYSENEKIIYPGSTISLGFDEIGKHGMIVGDTEKQKIEYIELEENKFSQIELDCTEIKSIEEIIEKINNLKLAENYLYKIILTGKRNFEIEKYELYKYELPIQIIKIENKTKINYDIEKISNQKTLKGLFAEEILKLLKNNEYDKKTIEKAFEIGMEILDENK